MSFFDYEKFRYEDFRNDINLIFRWQNYVIFSK